MTALFLALIAGPALLALVLTVFNAATWPRGGPRTPGGRVAVLIPARNEEETIRRAVESALAQEPSRVIVYDDGSTDRTGAILREIAAVDSRLKVLDGAPLPPGWVGKPHACHRLAEAADSDDVLWFMDADVELEPGALQRVSSLFEDYDADAVTAVPRQITSTWFEKLVLPLLHLTYVSWLPIPLVWRSRDPRFLAANGQLLAIRRRAYVAVGGFEAVRDAIVDDMAICRRLKETGHRVVFADGHHIARCRMYGSAIEVWEGFSKNIYAGLGSVGGFALANVLFIWTFLAGWIVLGTSVVVDLPTAVVGASLVAVVANLAQRVLLAVRHRHAFLSTVLHPLSIAALLAIAANSLRWYRRNEIRWSGRSYATRRADAE